MALKFLKTGAESAALAKQAEIEAEQRKAQIGKLWRFFLQEKEKARITFIDGNLTKEGILLPPRWYEHNLFLNGSWNNFFVCPEKTNPNSGEVCPIDESGDRAALVAGFTIIDHRIYKSSKSDKIYKDTRKIVVAKPYSFEILNAIAVKRGGLAGCTFEISRIGDKSAAIGSMFDFEGKTDIETLEKMYMHEVTDPKTNKKETVTYFIPADFEQEITYYTGDELRKMGLGKTTAPLVNAPGWVTGEKEKPKVDYSEHL